MLYDFYRNLVGAQDQTSLYYIQDQINIEDYIELLLTELVSFFKRDILDFFKLEMRKLLKRVVDKNITNQQKLAIIKNIVQKQIAPQIKKYLQMELNPSGLPMIDQSKSEQERLDEVIN